MNILQADSNSNTRLKRFPIKNQIEITGPGNLIRKLVEIFPQYEKEDLLFVWLDKKNMALAIDQVLISDIADPELKPVPIESDSQLVTICRSETRESGISIASKFNLKELSTLDVLIIADNSWWSFLCSDNECCPESGRPIATSKTVDLETYKSRHEIWLKWLNFFNLLQGGSEFKFDKDLEKFLRLTLDDLAIRDCLLNHLAINEESQATWTKLFERLLSSNQTHNNHVLYCLLAAINFSRNELNKADFYTKQSLLLNPEYSLSLLMQHGLEIQMDCKKVVAAFTHYSADELLNNTPKSA